MLISRMTVIHSYTVVVLEALLLPLFLSNMSVDRCNKNQVQWIKFTQLSSLNQDLCWIAAEAQISFVFIQAEAHTDVIAKPTS